MRHARINIPMVAGLALLMVSCVQEAPGLRRTPTGQGPVVRYDLLTRPFPDIPFPNDVATRPDPISPTGLRLNLGLDADSRMERITREKLNQLDGFGTFQPVTVAFDAPLDLDNLIARHRENLSFVDDAVYLVDVTPSSPTFGRPVLLDMGRGNYPATLRDGTIYHPADPRQDSRALLFETVDEDVNGNGLMDPGEDTDHDGVLDAPNVWPPGASVEEGLLTFYEHETDTLILRPVLPLREQTTYAVILTERLTGQAGQAVRSPFPMVHHGDQFPALSDLDTIFASWADLGVDLAVDQVSFAWTFTTQSVTGDLVAIREGLYGHGPLSTVLQSIPADAIPRAALSEDQPPPRYLLDIEVLKALAAGVLIPAFDITPAQGAALVEDLDHVDYVVQGAFQSPDFLTDEGDYIWDWSFDVDRRRGTARMEPSELLFTMTVPRATADHGPPFPVAVYSHGFGQARVEFLGFAGILARYGIACVGIDSWGHGIYIRNDDKEMIDDLAGGLGFGPFVQTFLEGRARDLNGDGKIDAGGDMFSTYAFHSRDTMRQSVVDTLQLVRVLKGFDGQRTWALDQDEDGSDDLAGDFDGDGLVDAGGPSNPFFLWGSSLGGLLSGVVGALEPAIVAAAPVAGGGGLTLLVSRSQQETVRNDTVMRALGPVLAGERVSELSDEVRVRFLFPLARKLRSLNVGTLSGLEPGFQVRLTLPDRPDGEHWATVSPQGDFAIHFETDRGDRFVVETFDLDGNPLQRLDTWPDDVHFWQADRADFHAGDALRSPAEGWGLHRGSPDLRRLIGIAQAIMDPGDAINYARHFFLEPLDIQPEGPTVTNLLELVTLGDNMNPMDTHGAVTRAAGIIEVVDTDPRYGRSVNDWLIDNWVYEGYCGYDRFPPNVNGDEVIFDPDRLDDLTVPPGEDGNGFHAPGPDPGNELRLKVETATGVSGVRFGHMKPCGKHSFFITDPSNAFNVDEYLASLAGHWFRNRAQLILDDPCHEDSSCPL